MLRDNLMLYLLGGGSDYVRGVEHHAPIRNCGIKTIMKHMKAVKPAEPLCCVEAGAGGVVAVGPGLLQLLGHFLRGSEIVALRPVLDAACWNIFYWERILVRSYG